MMKKEVLIGTGIAAVLTVGVIFDALTWGPVSVSQTPNNRPTSQIAIQTGRGDDVAEAIVKGQDIDSVEEQVCDQSEGISEAEAAAAIQGKATISATDAEAAALVGTLVQVSSRLSLTMRMVSCIRRGTEQW